MGVAVASTEAQNKPKEFVYLCQIDETVSCGACCGLYNIKDLSQHRLESLLAGRTEAFVSVDRTEDGIYAFQQQVELAMPREKPFPEFHHCPFVGLVGANKSRIGCLLHPYAAGNDGKDFRWLSWYGALACRVYFCTSHRTLSPTHRLIVREAMTHWYLYGLIVTEHQLLTAFFKEIESRIARPVTVTDFSENPVVRELFREFAGLKLDWPFRRENAPGPCNHVFDNGEYPRPDVERVDPKIPLSRYETFFRELDSSFKTPDELLVAQTRLDDLFSRLESVLCA